MNDTPLAATGSEAFGWRFWFIYQEEAVCGGTVLSSAETLTRWLDKKVVAKCKRGCESPPDPSCKCGLYADVSMNHSFGRMQMWRAAFHTMARRSGQRFAEPICVLGTVVMSQWCWTGPLAGPGLYAPEWEHDYREIRAASAEIIWLRVYQTSGMPAGLVERLGRRYGVPVEVQPAPDVFELTDDQIASGMARADLHRCQQTQ